MRNRIRRALHAIRMEIKSRTYHGRSNLQAAIADHLTTELTKTAAQLIAGVEARHRRPINPLPLLSVTGDKQQEVHIVFGENASLQGIIREVDKAGWLRLDCGTYEVLVNSASLETCRVVGQPHESPEDEANPMPAEVSGD